MAEQMFGRRARAAAEGADFGGVAVGLAAEYLGVTARIRYC